MQQDDYISIARVRHYEKICRVARSRRWLYVKRGLLRLALLAGVLGFGVYGVASVAAIIIATITASACGFSDAARVLEQVPGKFWAHLLAWLGSLAGWVALHLEHERVSKRSLDAWSLTSERQQARLREGPLWREEFYQAALADLGLVRHAQLYLGSSLAASLLTICSLDAVLEERAKEIERELAERARYLGLDPEDD